ncbi:MAG: TIGR00730 family Rossman fold protein [Thermoleophilaceae bacterium]
MCVFAGSRDGADPAYTEAAARLAEAIVAAGLGLVYGGGRVGLMGAVADAALAEGGEAIGVIPSALQRREIAHRGLTELHVVESMHERKAMMAQLCDAFVALPGGFGTMDELVEAVTWSQLGIHSKPVGLLDVAGYWQPLRRLVDHAVDQGFVAPAGRDLLIWSDDPAELLTALGEWRSARGPG